MSLNHLLQKICGITILSLVSFNISSCQASSPLPVVPETSQAIPILKKDQTLTKAQICSDLFTAHIDAWNSRSVENLRKIYTEDIVHFDGMPLFVGIDEVTGMAEDMWQIFPDWEMKAGSSYISDEACLGQWINWNVFSFPEEDPAYEFDLLNYREDRIYYWRAFYDVKFLDVFDHSDYIDLNFLNTFAAAWSSEDPTRIAEIYSDEAVLTDSLFSVSLEGSKAIADYAAAYIAQFPGVTWDLVFPFAEDYSEYDLNEENPFHPQGGVFRITLQDPEAEFCEIQAVVLITPNDVGKIIEQSIYYDAESLVSCGLAK